MLVLQVLLLRELKWLNFYKTSFKLYYFSKFPSINIETEEQNPRKSLQCRKINNMNGEEIIESSAFSVTKQMTTIKNSNCQRER